METWLWPLRFSRRTWSEVILPSCILKFSQSNVNTSHLLGILAIGSTKILSILRSSPFSDNISFFDQIIVKTITCIHLPCENIAFRLGRSLVIRFAGYIRTFNRAFSFPWRGQHTCEFIADRRKCLYKKKSWTNARLAWDTNMAAVSLFWNTNMSAVYPGHLRGQSSKL